MSDVVVKAPANIKISGEHSVVYGGPSLSAAINIYATTEVKSTGAKTFDVDLTDLKLKASFNGPDLRRIHEEFNMRDRSTNEGIRRFIDNNKDIDDRILPYAVIAARLLAQYGVDVLGKEVIVHSEVPIQRGYASSAVCSTSIMMALLKSEGREIGDQDALDIARDGERIVHGMETAGRMDVGPAFYGGYATFSIADGIRKADLSANLDIIIIDVGPKPPTSEMLKKVRERYARDEKGTKEILGKIDRCVFGCIDSLKKGDLKSLGKEININHDLLGLLGVSSDKLNRAVKLAVNSGALGAKMCGGGGGGIGMALVDGKVSEEKVIKTLKDAGFDAYSVSITFEGAK